MEARNMRCHLRRLGRRGILVVAACVAVSALGALSMASAYPPCFGAASRDPYHTCHNRNLDLAVIPTPREAQIVPNAPCYPLAERTPLEHLINACIFGVREGATDGTIALVGNSHAAHWRAAVAVVADSLDWYGVSITRSSCPFLVGTVELPEPKRAQCIRWHKAVVTWFRLHPEVTTVFVSDQPTPVVTAHGQSENAAQVAGYEQAWAELPASVTHIIVIRDNPYVHPTTLPCVEAAMARHKPAGLACALRRSQALKPDPEVTAAEALHAPRVQVIDLTHFFCDAALCYPVVGGALVYRDEDHLTRVFAATLGPYLLHALGTLMASW